MQDKAVFLAFFSADFDLRFSEGGIGAFLLWRISERLHKKTGTVRRGVSTATTVSQRMAAAEDGSFAQNP